MTDLTSAAREFAVEYYTYDSAWNDFIAEAQKPMAEFAKTYAESRTADLVAALKDAREAISTYADEGNWKCSNDEMCGKVKCDCPKDWFVPDKYLCDGFDGAAEAIAAIDKVLEGGKHE